MNKKEENEAKWFCEKHISQFENENFLYWRGEGTHNDELKPTYRATEYRKKEAEGAEHGQQH